MLTQAVRVVVTAAIRGVAPSVHRDLQTTARARDMGELNIMHCIENPMID